jgi:DNA-binding CsgD family transcriptional regulator
MEVAAAAIPCTGAALMPVRVHFPLMPCSAAIAELSHEYLNSGWQSRDVRYAGLPAMFRYGVTSDLAFATPDELAKDSFYQELLAPFDCPWFAGIKIETENEVRCLTFQRSAAQGPFADDELRQLVKLSDSLTGTAALACALNFAKAEAALTAFEVSETAVFLMNAKGEVALANPSAERLLGSDLKRLRGRLTSSTPGDTVKLDRALSVLLLDPAPRGSMPPVVLRRAGGKRPLLACVMRLPKVTTDVFGAARAAIVMMDLDRRPAPPETILRETFGLTATQARLARHIATGRSLEEAAEALGLSRETSRSHLKAVFAKTETHRQAELAAMLSRILEIPSR